MPPDLQGEAGLLSSFAAALRRHPSVSVPLVAAALAAALGFSVSAYTFAATVAQSEDLHVPMAFVPATPRVVSVGRGVIVAGLLALIALVVIVLLDRLTRPLRDRSPTRGRRRLAAWLASLSPTFELAARAAGLLAVAAGLAMVWLNAVTLAAFVWTPNPIQDGWLVADTVDTDVPVLVLEDQNGAILLRPLKHVGGDRYAPCGPVARAVANDVALRYVEELGRLVGDEHC